MTRINRNKIFKALSNPRYFILALYSRGFLNWMSDELSIKVIYYCKMGKKVNLSDPKTYNEKLQWIKLNYYNKEYTNLVDKYEVRKYISEKVGDEYLIPLLGVYEDVDDINFDELPNQFVLKCTHDSGGVIICKDKKELNIKNVKKKLKKLLKKNFYYYGREWPYKDIKPRIICEKFMVDESGIELKDYKFFCFDGNPKALFIATDRGIDTRFDFFDINFNKMKFMQHYKNGVKKINKPIGYDEMVKLATILSQDMPHVRVDFYDINGKIYFGEFTFFHFSGTEIFEPEEYDYVFGEWINLPEKNRA